MTPIGAPGIFSSHKAPFNPVTEIGWAHAWYAEGAEFVAQGYSDGGAVGTWPDEIGTSNFTQSTASYKPTYRATAGPNSQPSVKGDSGDIMTGTTFTGIDTYSVVLIASNWHVNAFDVIGVNGVAISGGSIMYQEWQNTYGFDGADAFGSGRMNTGASATSTAPHLFTLYHSDAADDLEINGTSVESGNVLANASHVGWTKFMGMTNYLGDPINLTNAYVVFLAIYSGDVRSHGSWQSFEDWAEAKYGMTVA